MALHWSFRPSESSAREEEKSHRNFLLILASVVVIIFSNLTSYILLTRPRLDTSFANDVCTLEAKICPDGTYVGRTGPNCEFDECPTKEIKSTLSEQEAILIIEKKRI